MTTKQDHIIVIEPDGTERTIALTFRGLTVGTGSKNDVILQGQGVSQQHIRITFDGSDYSILPMPASLPAYLNDSQLLPSVEKKWGSDQVLKLGDNMIHLRQAKPELSVYESRPRKGQRREPASEQSSPHSEGEHQPFRIFMIGIGILAVVVVLYIVFGL